MEQRALLAIVLSLMILVGYQVLFAPTNPVAPGLTPVQAPASAPVRDIAPAPSVPASQDAAATRAAPANNAAAWSRPVDAKEDRVEVATPLYRAVLTSFGGRLAAFELTDYRLTTAPDSPPLDLVRSDSILPLGVSWRVADGSIRDDAQLAYILEVDDSRLTDGEQSEVRMVASAPDGTRVRKTLTFVGGSSLVDVAIEVEGGTGPVGVGWARKLDPSAGSYYVAEGPASYVEDTLESINASGMEEPESFSGLTSWAGYATHYFLTAYVPAEPRQLELRGTISGDVGVSTLWDSAAEGSVRYQLFAGPKTVKLLDDLGHDLRGAVNLGWFSIVANPLLYLLLLIEKMLGNYGLAIIVLTVLIRLLLWPVNARQMQAMKGMQRIQPEMKRLQERHKDDRDALNKEMMELYRRHKVNPLSGCLPMVLQLPFFIGLYNVLMQAIELRHAPFFGWIMDLSQPDRLGTLAIPFVTPPGIPVMTLLMGASMILQQRMTPATGDPQQARMMMLMPVVFTVMFVNFPAGLVLYWLANNLLSIGQQALAERSKA
ncbi:MAG: YidC/Oxa1 family membrane protein insertase [Hyphomicrobiaceae bacterium]